MLPRNYFVKPLTFKGDLSSASNILVPELSPCVAWRVSIGHISGQNLRTPD